MTDTNITECLALLEAADHILIDCGENVLAAHLSAVIEPLKARARTVPATVEAATRCS